MIQINCTNCKALLQIDDAFAGGVCRCRYCGTIQTVPKHLRDSNGDGSGVMAVAAGAKAPKTLYQKKSASTDPGSGTGLDDLANIVASSGLSSKRLQRSAAAAAIPAVVMAPKSSNAALLLGAAGGVVSVVLGIIIFQAVTKPTSTDNKTVAQKPATIPNPVEVRGKGPDNSKIALKWKPPAFLGHPIGDKSIVYVIDRGQASSNKLDAMKLAVVQSLRSLGPQKKFQVIFWEVDKQIVAYPKDGMVNATPENIAACSKAMDEVIAQGQSSATASMEKAFKANPEGICLVAAKTFLPDNFASEILKKKGSSKARVYTFSLAQPEAAPALQKVSSDTKGFYKDISPSDLSAAGRD